MLCKQTSVLITVILLSKSHLNTPEVILIFALPQQFIIVQIMLTQTKFAWSPHCGSSLGIISLAGSSGHQSASFFLLIIQLLPNYSLRTSGWRATATQENVGARWGVIGVHALCIISYSEEDSTARGNESSQQCTEVSAANTNEEAAFARRNIWLKSHVVENTAQPCYQQKHIIWKEVIFGAFFR